MLLQILIEAFAGRVLNTAAVSQERRGSQVRATGRRDNLRTVGVVACLQSPPSLPPAAARPFPSISRGRLDEEDSI